MTHICVVSSLTPTIIYMGGLILGVNTLYRFFCFFKLFPMVGKGLTCAFWGCTGTALSYKAETYRGNSTDEVNKLKL